PRAPPVRVPPHALDLPHLAGQRSHFGIEDDFAVLESRESTTTGGQLRHPCTVVRTTVAVPRIHADLLEEHRHGGGIVSVQISHPDLTHAAVGGDGGQAIERKQRLVGTHLTCLTPLRRQLLPQRENLFGWSDE